MGFLTDVVKRCAVAIATFYVMEHVPLTVSARADIFRWQYVVVDAPWQGKFQTTILVPDGAGVEAVPGADLSFRDLNMAYLLGKDLHGAGVSHANLRGADVSGANLTDANLTNANFSYSTLIGTNFTGAQVQRASFAYSGLTLAQLQSTASFQDHDLTGIVLWGNDNLLSYSNFAGFNLTDADFHQSAALVADFSQANLTHALISGANLTGANLKGANLTNANLYQATLTVADFSQANLTNASFYVATLTSANLSQANLTNANFDYARLKGANLTGAIVQGANFRISGLTAAQLQSTASYKAHDLSGIVFDYTDLSGGDFTGQKFTNAHFDSTNLFGANFSGADLRNAYFAYVGLDGVNLTGADSRGSFLNYGDSFPPSAITTNLIQLDGHIAGLDLNGGEQLVIRNYDGNLIFPDDPVPALPILIDKHFLMGPGGSLQMRFETDAWNSKIYFDAGIPVALGGTLSLLFADGVDVANQVGRIFELFDWTGISPTGEFAVDSPYSWDLSRLYTTGEVTLTGVPEPATFVLAASGALGLSMCTRRRAALFVVTPDYAADRRFHSSSTVA